MVAKQYIVENVVAQGVTFEAYMKDFAADFAEWVQGDVIKMSPIAEIHDSLFQFFIRFLGYYMDETNAGLIRVAPFVMRITPSSSAREPDLQIILKERAAIVQRTLTAGAADIVIEIVSEESETRDTETKFTEYQNGGVSEYWLLNPLNRTSRFFRLNQDGKYALVELINGVFQSSVLPRFQLDTQLLWQKPLPTGKQIVALIEAMLNK